MEEEMTEAEELKAPVLHGVINTADMSTHEDAPNIETQAAETLALPEARTFDFTGCMCALSPRNA